MMKVVPKSTWQVEAMARATCPTPPANNQIKPSVVPVTRLACARRAPVPPAAYLVRWAAGETRE